MKIVLYARVSRDDLHCENQKIILLNWINSNNIREEDFDYLQEEISSRKTRPNKELIMQKFREGYYKTIIITRIDRFARSMQELILNVEEIINKGGRFVSLLNNFDFEKKNYNASNQLVFNIFASFAQFERELIRERTLEGLSRAKALGKVLGRPRKTPPVEPTLNPI